MNDDDADFKPSQSTSSNLTTLFDTNRPRPNDNQTLTYTAPKPPKAGESSGTPARGSSTKSVGTEKLEIIISKNIQLFKLENDKYVSEGTAGIAIIGHYDLHMYQIILYKNNKEYLSKTYLQPNFIFTVLENNYASFYDNARQNWSILFQSSSDVEHFAKQVAISKYNSQSKEEKMIVQDLIPLGKARANNRDIVELGCRCSVLNNDEIIPFKENLNWSVEVADNYTFPWQKGLRDCGYKCRRAVIIPYNLSAPWTEEIQQNNPVLVEIEVLSIRPPRRPGQKKKIPVTTQDGSTTDSSADEDNCKAKPGSLADSIFLSRSHKADLISRIAKMGQALPLKVAFACGPTDLPDENSSMARQANTQAVPSNFHPCSPQQTDAHQQYALSTSSSRRCDNDVVWQQQQARGGLNFACQELHPMMSGPPGPSGQSYGRGPETTATDAELRFTINKVSEKVDHVLNQLQTFGSSKWDKTKAHHSATILDPVSVINSIQDVMAENECLKAEIQQQKSKLNEQGCKLHSLMELTQRCVERCAFPDHKRAVTPAADRMVGSEEGLNTSEQLMTGTNAKINQLSIEIEKYKRENSENQQQIKQCQAEIQGLVEKLKEKERIIRNMETELVQTAAENEALINAKQQQKRDIQRYMQQDLGEKPSEVQPASSENLVEEIKKVMNAVNRKFQSNFDSDQSYSGKDIKASIATTLKDVTMEYLKYRTKQKNASRLDVGHKESRITTDERKTSSQRLSLAEYQASRELRDEPVEEPEISRSRLAQGPSARVSAQSSFQPTPGGSTLAQDVKSIATFGGESRRDSNARGSSEEETASVSSVSSARVLSIPSRTAYERRSTVPASRLPSVGKESMRRDNSAMTGELESLLEDHEAENVEVEKSTVTLTRTVSDVTKHSAVLPSSHRSTITARRETLSSWDMASSDMPEESATMSGRSTLSDAGHRSKTEEHSKKKKSEGTVSGEESSVFLSGERSDETRVASSRITRDSETRSAYGRGTSSEIDEGVGRQTRGTTSGVASNVESFAAVRKNSTAPPSGISSRGVVQQESGTQSVSGKSTASSKIQSQARIAEAEGYSRGGSIHEDDSPFDTEQYRFEESSPPLSDSHGFEGTTESVGKSLSETDLSNKVEHLDNTVEDGSIVNFEIEKSSVVLNKTLSNVKKELSNQVPPTHVLVGSDNESSLTEDFDMGKSQTEDEENATGDALEKDGDRADTEKNSIEEKLSSSTSDENIRTSGSNAVHDALYSDYYQRWESSKPPPLEDSEDSSGTDEEWL